MLKAKTSLAAVELPNARRASGYRGHPRYISTKFLVKDKEASHVGFATPTSLLPASAASRRAGEDAPDLV